MNFAEAHVGDIRGTSVVVVGAGKMWLRAWRAASSTTAAARSGCCTAPTWTASPTRSPVRDIVVTSTGAQNFMLTTGERRRSDDAANGPSVLLFIVDIAVPRDCDPDVAAIPGVQLVDVDGLRGVVDITLERRREAIPMVEEIITEHAERFHHWYQSRVAVPVISSIVQSAETLRERELQRLFSRCPELTAGTREDADHRHVVDDRLEALAYADYEHP